jgi:hypothetical protein
MKHHLLYVAALAVSIGLTGSAQGQEKTQAQQAQEAARAKQDQKDADRAETRRAQAEKSDRADTKQKQKQQQQQKNKRQTERQKANAAAAAVTEAKTAEAAAANAAAAGVAAADAKAAADASLPPALRGFDGTLSGTVVRADKDGEHLVLRPNRILHTSPRSTAATPEAGLNGAEVNIYPGLDSHGDPEQQRQWIRSLHANRQGSDKVPVDVKEVDGKLRINSLTPEALQEAQKFADAAQKATLPEALRGFNGTLSGTVVSADKGGEHFVLRPKQVLHTSPQSTAAKPEAVAGIDVTIYPGQGPHGDPEQQRQWIRSLHANRQGDDKVPVDVKEVDGKLRINALTPEAQQAAAQIAPAQPTANETPAPK